MGAIKMKIPKEVIIVEGRDDTKRLIETFGPDIKTIETNGSAFSRSVQTQVLAAAEKFGIIVLTDPDYQGERVRRLVTELVPGAKHAFLSQSQADSGKVGRSLGVEHATPEDIRLALDSVMTPYSGEVKEIPMADLYRLKLIGHPQSGVRREILSQELRLGHLNGKQLIRKLAQYQISLEKIERILEEKGFI